LKVIREKGPSPHRNVADLLRPVNQLTAIADY
jgi:hypothetical protein